MTSDRSISTKINHSGEAFTAPAAEPVIVNGEKYPVQTTAYRRSGVRAGASRRRSPPVEAPGFERSLARLTGDGKGHRNLGRWPCRDSQRCVPREAPHYDFRRDASLGKTHTAGHDQPAAAKRLSVRVQKSSRKRSSKLCLRFRSFFLGNARELHAEDQPFRQTATPSRSGTITENSSFSE
jgi:hypothetical protein